MPGGFNPGFELIEMNACCYEDTWEQAQQYWNRHLSGELERFYPISAGSDVHDVWTERSGSPRLYARIEGEPSVDGFVASVEAGHAYATFGPLIVPQTAAGGDEPVLFGKRYRVEAGEAFEFAVDLTAVEGLRRVALIREGEEVDSRDLSDRGQSAQGVAFSVAPEDASWYALVVEDASENRAYSNPIWMKVP